MASKRVAVSALTPDYSYNMETGGWEARNEKGDVVYRTILPPQKIPEVAMLKRTEEEEEGEQEKNIDKGIPRTRKFPFSLDAYHAYIAAIVAAIDYGKLHGVDAMKDSYVCAKAGKIAHNYVYAALSKIPAFAMGEPIEDSVCKLIARCAAMKAAEFYERELSKDALSTSVSAATNNNDNSFTNAAASVSLHCIQPDPHYGRAMAVQ
jgi:hypothetical protein